MTRDLTPSRADLWRLVEHYGSITHAARAVAIAPDEMNDWLNGRKEIPAEHYEALLSLIGSIATKK